MSTTSVSGRPMTVGVSAEGHRSRDRQLGDAAHVLHVARSGYVDGLKFAGHIKYLTAFPGDQEPFIVPPRDTLFETLRAIGGQWEDSFTVAWDGTELAITRSKGFDTGWARARPMTDGQRVLAAALGTWDRPNSLIWHEAARAVEALEYNDPVATVASHLDVQARYQSVGAREPWAQLAADANALADAGIETWSPAALSILTDLACQWTGPIADLLLVARQLAGLPD